MPNYSLSPSDIAWLEEMNHHTFEHERNLENLRMVATNILAQRDEYARQAEQYFGAFLITLGLLVISLAGWLWVVLR